MTRTTLSAQPKNPSIFRPHFLQCPSSSPGSTAEKPVSIDQHRSALRAERLRTFRVGHIPDLLIIQPVFLCLMVDPVQRRFRGPWNILHMVHRHERREMMRDSRSEICCDPVQHRIDLRLTVVISRDHERHQFQMEAKLLGKQNRIKHRLQSCPADRFIKFIREPLQIDPDRPKIRGKFKERLLLHITVRDERRGQSVFLCKFRRIIHILKRDRRLIVGERDTFCS